MYHSPTKSIKKDQFVTSELQNGIKSLARKRAKEKNIFQMEFLCDQIYAMMGPGEKVLKRNKYFFETSEISLMFGLSNSKMVLNYRAKGQKNFDGISKSFGRPSALTNDQDKKTLEFILSREKENLPLTPTELLEWVNNSFSLNLQQSWPFGFVKSHENHICMKNAQPLESARAELTVYQLKDYGNQLKN